MAIPCQPFDHLQSLLPGLPAFVRIHAHRLVWRGFAECRQIHFVIRDTDLHLQYRISLGFQNLLANDLGFIDSNGEGSDMLLLPETESKHFGNGFPGAFTRAVEQCKVHGAFGGHVAR